jgi:hypothetical protein
MNEWMNRVDERGAGIAGKRLEVEKWKNVKRVIDEAA